MAFSTTDTIVAIATPPGRGGIGVVRISGPDARTVAAYLITRTQPLEPRHATFTKSRLKPDPAMPDSIEGGRAVAHQEVDHVVATYFPGPHSYTGEDVVELSAHGSPVVLRAIVAAAMTAGARLAEPGEFTLRAFLNGRLDLPQAEAVADLIDAATPLQARAAFDQLQGTLTKEISAIDERLFDLIARLEASIDFPDEGYHFVEPEALARELETLRERTKRLMVDGRTGRLVREGLTIAIVGKPNVGKSSVFNALVGTSRAIVSSTPGTTRDLITETFDLDGLKVTLTDTAGHRSTNDVVEAEGVARSRQASAVADVTLVVLDASEPLDDEDRYIISQVIESKRLIVINKTDLRPAWSDPMAAVHVSAATGAGLEQLRLRIAAALDLDLLSDRPAITNARHIGLVNTAFESIDRARAAATASLSEEFVLSDLQAARAAFEEVTGRRTSDDVLAHVFSRFCVGK
ncbi:MAG TPA: tRNA uridine-5-carboxymethylaminomethyl(34) synthesis GTPase MnmE [Vicinamibacterales bacterium]|nr:tRNA uridine-5-carboxymethylaminomethyl(34) synthesis GTPase MnmE [Vicinamibacterales bacterium]